MNSKAFTLVELMVCILIIAILAALLVPGYARLRYSAGRAGCMSNLRQIGIALISYAGDNAGNLPPELLDRTLSYNYTFWTGGGVWSDLGILYHENYIGNPQVLYCPGRTTPTELMNNTQWNDPTQRRMGYLYNFTAASLPGSYKLSRLGGVPIVYDNIGTPAFFTAHNAEGANVLFGDGTVLWYSDGATLMKNSTGDDGDLRASLQLFEEAHGQ